MDNGKVVIVTGGTYGIGRAITLTLAAQGYRVVTFGLNSRQIGSTAEATIPGTQAELARRGLQADVLEADVSRAGDVQRVVDFTIGKYQRIDGLVNNAAIRPTGSILETSEEDWDRTMAVNLKGMFLACKAVIPHMLQQGGGAIVNVGSGSGWGRPNLLAYCASKGGVFAFSTALAYDHLYDRIRVNVVVPGGGVLSGMTEGLPNFRRSPPRTAAGRHAEPDDVASAVAFLLSDAAVAISGAVLTVGCFDGQGGPIPEPRPARAAVPAHGGPQGVRS